MTIENLYQQAQVFLDASLEGRPLSVNSNGQLKAPGLGERAVASMRGLISTDSARQMLVLKRNRDIVKALIRSVEDAISPERPDESVVLSHTVEWLDSSYKAGQLPAAQTFISLLRQAELKR
jgi:CRISPR/Cas system type I-B associated protein Csh2 (Cas7 group RAMP superfamily)